MDGTWHFIVATYDGTTETIYADGTPLSPSRTNFTAPNVQAANFVVGKTTADVNFTGLLDDLLIANTALSSAQIAALYNSGVGNGGSSNILPATTALKVASGGTLDLNGPWQQVASLSDAAPGSGGSIINSNLEAPAVLTISPTGGSTTFSGSIEGGGTLGSLGLVLSGPGTLVLSGSNSYEGGTTVAEGTLIVATGGALPTGTSLTVGGWHICVRPFGGGDAVGAGRRRVERERRGGGTRARGNRAAPGGPRDRNAPSPPGSPAEIVGLIECEQGRRRVHDVLNNGSARLACF